MKKTTLKNLSFVGLFLLAASAVTAAVNAADSSDADAAFAPGSMVDSTGGGLTVHAGADSFSHTATGAPGNQIDNLSATSANIFAQTNTQDIGNNTAGGTTNG